MLKVWIWGKLHLWTTVGFMTNVLDDFHWAGALGFWSMYLKLSVLTDQTCLFGRVSAKSMFTFIFPMLFATLSASIVWYGTHPPPVKTLKSCPDVRPSNHFRCQTTQILLDTKNKLCYTFFYIKASSSFQCVSFWVNTVYWETCVTMFIVHCSLFPITNTVTLFLSQNFLLFPEFSITSRRFYIVMALNCVNNKIVMSLINGNGRVL